MHKTIHTASFSWKMHQTLVLGNHSICVDVLLLLWKSIHLSSVWTYWDIDNLLNSCREKLSHSEVVRNDILASWTMHPCQHPSEAGFADKQADNYRLNGCFSMQKVLLVACIWCDKVCCSDDSKKKTREKNKRRQKIGIYEKRSTQKYTQAANYSII